MRWPRGPRGHRGPRRLGGLAPPPHLHAVGRSCHRRLLLAPALGQKPPGLVEGRVIKALEGPRPHGPRPHGSAHPGHTHTAPPSATAPTQALPQAPPLGVARLPPPSWVQQERRGQTAVTSSGPHDITGGAILASRRPSWRRGGHLGGGSGAGVPPGGAPQALGAVEDPLPVLGQRHPHAQQVPVGEGRSPMPPIPWTLTSKTPSHPWTQASGTPHPRPQASVSAPQHPVTPILRGPRHPGDPQPWTQDPPPMVSGVQETPTHGPRHPRPPPKAPGIRVSPTAPTNPHPKGTRASGTPTHGPRHPGWPHSTQ